MPSPLEFRRVMRGTSLTILADSEEGTIGDRCDVYLAARQLGERRGWIGCGSGTLVPESALLIPQQHHFLAGVVPCGKGVSFPTAERDDRVGSAPMGRIL